MRYAEKVAAWAAEQLNDALSATCWDTATVLEAAGALSDEEPGKEIPTLVEFANTAANDILESSTKASHIEVASDDLVKWGTLLRSVATELVVATKTDQQRANEFAERIITARGRDLHDFLTKYSGTPGVDGLLFCDLEPEEGELTAAYVSVVPVSILSAPVSAEVAITYPTIRVGTKLINTERPNEEVPAGAGDVVACVDDAS